MNTLTTIVWQELGITIQVLDSLLPDWLRKNQRGIPESLQRLGAALVLLALMPLLVLTAIIIRLESRGPVIFSQTRVGKNGRRFRMYKFRSMYTREDPRYVDPSNLKSDREGVCQKLFRDPRITRVGRIIRKLSIDELPQLLNILKGDMLLIGPRPCLVNEAEQYDYFMLERMNVKPGLTCLWQVMGRANLDFQHQISLDIRYVRESSLAMDIRILLMTIPAVITGRGAY